LAYFAFVARIKGDVQLCEDTMLLLSCFYYLSYFVYFKLMLYFGFLGIYFLI